MEAAPYLKDDQRAGTWNQMLSEAINLIEKQDKGDRFGSSLAVRVS
jgi:hypothetical protein